MADVLIAGGGIAGSALAILLGRLGVSVELFERDRFPREKPCGEGLMPAGVRALERLGLAEAVGGAPFFGVRYRLGDLVAEGRFPPYDGRPAVGRGQRRRHLDRVLFEAAAATPGVCARSGVTVEDVILDRLGASEATPLPVGEGRVRASPVRVTGLRVDGHAHHARLVVAADGVRSRVRQRLGLDGPPSPRARVGVRAHYLLAHNQPELPWVEVYLGRGYELYVTPLPERGLLVAGLAEAGQLRGGATSALDRWIAEQPALAARLVGSERITRPCGRAPLAATALAGFAPGCVLLGDAAGYLDPITGGGMTQALLSAEVLARHIPSILAIADGDASAHADVGEGLVPSRRRLKGPTPPRLAADAAAAGDEPPPYGCRAGARAAGIASIRALARFDAERRRLLREYDLLTRGVLLLSSRPELVWAAVRVLRASPPLFSRLIGLAGGHAA